MTSFRHWTEEINDHLRVFSPTNVGFSVSLAKKDENGLRPLSPITNFLLNIWSYSIKDKKNLIVTFPSNSLNTIPILSYLYTCIKRKSVLVFSSGSINERSYYNKDHLIKKHNQNYQLLTSSGYDYLFKNTPICTIKDDKLDIEVHLPRAQPSERENLIKSLKQTILSSKGPKIILSNSRDRIKIDKTVNGISTGNEEINQNLDLDLGCIIFENAERFINSQDSAEIFIKWLKDNVGEEVQLLFHFSNFNPKYIDIIKENTNSLLIPLNQNVLKNNSDLLKQSSDYFYSNNLVGFKYIKNYNLDNKNTYIFNSDMEVVEPLKNGNIDFYLYQSNNIIKNIDFDSIKNKYFYNYAKKLIFFTLMDLSINPYYFYTYNKYLGTSISVPQFINLYLNNLNVETEENQSYIRDLLSNLYELYLEFYESKAFKVKDTFEREAKDYKLLEIATNKEKYFQNENDLIIGTYEKNEVGTLRRILKDTEGVEVLYLENLYSRDIEFSKYNLLLSGVLPPYFSSILKINFKKVLILAYEGNNYNMIKQQIDAVLNPNIENEKIAMDYFEELCDYIGLKKDWLFSDFNKRYEEFKNNSSENNEDEEEGSDEEFPTTDIYDLNKNYSNYVRGRKKADSYLDSYSSTNYQYDDYETISFRLKNLEFNETSIKKLIKNKKYLKFESYENIENAVEAKPSMINDNDYIIVLDENRSFLDLYIEVFDEVDDIDRDLLNYWRDLLADHIYDNKLSYRAFHNIYKDYCIKTNQNYKSYNSIRLWARGFVIAPDNPEDLKILAEIFSDDYLLENYKYVYEEANKLRNFNITMGRRLSFLIKEIIHNADSIDYVHLSFQERRIYDKIKNSVYLVVKKLD